MSGFVVKAVIALVALTLIVLLVARLLRRYNPRRGYQPRQKLPAVIAVIGVLALAGGFVLALASFTSRYTEDLLPMRIASVVVFLLGVGVLLAYRNWYVEPGADAVRFRGLVGREKRIDYSAIASFTKTSSGNRHHLTVVAQDGTTLSIDPARYDMSPLNAAADFKQRTGRWPSPGELAPHPQA